MFVVTDPISRSRKTERRWMAFALALSAVVFLVPLLRPHPLIDPDEGLMASIAQEMVERGDWVTPRLHGEAFLDKPVLFTWAQAVSMRWLGMNEVAVRLPGFLFAWLSVAACGLIGWRMFSAATGVMATLFYGTMALPVALAQAPVCDVALVLWVQLALWLFWEGDRAKTRRGMVLCAMATGVVLGLSCLTKGFVGIGLVGVAYGSYLLVTRRLTPAACLRGAAALGVAALIAAPWYAAMEARNPGYLYYFFFERHVLGVATDSQLHADKPWWFYLPILLGGGLPWITYLPTGLAQWWTARADGESPSRRGEPAVLLVCWLVACGMLLSLAGSKLITYIWPVFPSLALLAALVWTRMLEGRLTVPARRFFALNVWATTAAGPLLLPVLLAVASHELSLRFGPVAWTVAIVAGLTAWIPLVLWRVGRPRGFVAAAPSVVVVQFVALFLLLGPPAAETRSAGALADYLNRQETLPQRLVVVHERIGSVLFYLRPELRAQLTPDSLERVSRGRLYRSTVDSPGTVYAVSDRNVHKIRRQVSLDGKPHQRSGRYRLYDCDFFWGVEAAHRVENATAAVR